ncbi:MAG TPA: MSMEG_1061 family FMN-dependent PPOX-type flavoprotein [Candidatus Binatia bacterium]|nr:MSMEG_1061 family FMN-dependent PPOX-type flavoprotein [Candidatus Binatia bacterium]
MMSVSPTSPRTAEDLCERFGPPEDLTVKHKLPYLDEAAARFISQCPFVIVATADAQGRCDASPKGDPPGFLHIADERTLYLPDRSGNKMFQSITNIMQNPHVGMILIIPGEEWTMRINGQARVVDDPAVLERLSARGRPAQLAIEIKVEECFFHCPRSFKRAELWNSERFQKYQGDSWGKILAQRTNLASDKVELLEQGIAEAVKHLP